MAVLDQKAKVGGGFSNGMQIVEVEYDFSVDGGAVDDYDVLEADKGCVVEFMHAYVETALTSGGALVVDLGKGAGGVEFLSDKAVGDFSANAVIKGDAYGTDKVHLASGEKIVMGFEAAAATAGKMRLKFAVYKA